MLILVWVVCIFICLINIKYNNNKLRFLSLILMVFIMSCNNKAVDEMNLYYSFSQIQDGTYKTYDITNFVFFDIMMGIANKLGLSFGMFNFCIFLPSFLLLDHSLKKLLPNPSTVYFLFVVTSILLDTTLARQFIASVFVIYAITFLVGHKQSILKFIIFTVIGASIHFSMIVFLSFLLVKINIKRTHFRLLIIAFSALFLVITLANGKQIFGITEILNLIGSTKINYGSSAGVGNGWLYSLIIWIIMYFVANTIRNRSKQIMSNEDYTVIDSFSMMIVISLIFVSLSMMTMVYSRLLRPTSWLIFIMIAKWNQYKKIYHHVNVQVMVSFLLFIIGYSIIFNNIIFYPPATIEPVLNGIPFWDLDYSKIPWPILS